jgi:hypothetical protein
MNKTLRLPPILVLPLAVVAAPVSFTNLRLKSSGAPFLTAIHAWYFVSEI